MFCAPGIRFHRRSFAEAAHGLVKQQKQAQRRIEGGFFCEILIFVERERTTIGGGGTRFLALRHPERNSARNHRLE
jgi:hypothetical protein